MCVCVCVCAPVYHKLERASKGMLICKDSKGTVEVFTCSVHTAVPADGAATFSNTLQGAEDISSWLGNKRPPTALLPATMTLAKEWLYPEAPGYKKIWTR